MRIMLSVALDTAISNKLVENGKVGQILEEVLGGLRPESASFHPADGRPAMTLVVDVPDGSYLAGLAEPFWLKLGATVDATPVMNLDELKTALSRMG